MTVARTCTANHCVISNEIPAGETYGLVALILFLAGSALVILSRR